MAILAVTGEAGCRTEDIARAAAQKLNFELVSETRLAGLLREEFGDTDLPDKAWPAAATSVLARAATDHNLVISFAGAECLFPNVPGVLRVFVTGRVAHRTGNVMLDLGTNRSAAAKSLRELEAAQRERRKRHFMRPAPSSHDFDLVLNSEQFQPEAAGVLIEAAAYHRAILDYGLLSDAAEAQIQFQARLVLAGHGIVPAGRSSMEKKPFGHPSEQLFANLLDFYRIAWEYEPRSFALQWDKDGKVTEAFTPDFYIPEFDLYVELTTMKQSLVTKKNRKVKLLRTIYPHINIQVFYLKDFQDLVSKYGLSDRAAAL